MPIILDHQLREQIPHNATDFPITYYHDELVTLPNWAGPLHWHPDFEIATAASGVLDYQVGQQHTILEAGDSIFVNGNMLHGIRQLSGDSPDPMPNIVFSGIVIAPENSTIYQKYIQTVAQCDSLPFIVFRHENSSHSKIGYRTCVVASQVVASVGLVSMAFLPELLPIPFAGILISVVLYAIGSGLIEVLVSPIVEACPFENKEGMMSLLHSFYCWGAMGVILGSTFFFAVFGIANWKILAIIWALVPLYNTFNFINCPIERLVEEGKSMSIGQLLRLPLFWLMIILMICSGASEATMAQWASAFTESAIGVSKTVGDLAGPCLFAMFMGISRMLYGKFSEKLDLTKVMLICGAMCAGCYLLASLSAFPILGLAGCALCGLAVGIMWPGSISISSQKCPRGGTAMFAFLALAGDLGAMVSPAMVGSISEMAGGNLKSGLLVATVFPIILVGGLIILNKVGKTSPHLSHFL